MRKVALLWLGIWLFGCKPEPFSTHLAGFPIRFPLAANELDTTKFTSPLYSSKYIDSTDLVMIEWLFDPYQDGKSDIYKLPDQRQAFGVNLYLKNQASRLDSVKKALEKQFGKPLFPVSITEIPDESYDNNLGYSCRLNPNTTLFLRKSTCPQGDSWCQENSLRICIGYNLKKAQLERLATSNSKIHKDYD